MKKGSGMFLVCIFLTCIGSVVFAKERTVQLDIPGCSTWKSNARIGSILKQIDGVKKYENRGNNTLEITFDDEKVTINMIIDVLKKEKFSVTGEPIYLK